MKHLFALAILPLAACTTYVPVDRPVAPPTQAIKYRLQAGHDPAMYLHSLCAAHFGRGTDGYTLCMARGIDHLQVVPEPLPRAVPPTGCCLGGPEMPLAPAAPGTSTIIIK